MHESHEAARAVAALLDLAAVGIEYAVAEIDIGPRRFFHQQDLVAANAAVAVGEPARLGGRQINVLAHRIDDNEVVAEAMHLGETDFHAGFSAPPGLIGGSP